MAQPAKPPMRRRSVSAAALLHHARLRDALTSWSVTTRGAAWGCGSASDWPRHAAASHRSHSTARSAAAARGSRSA
eukprot:CAMPEP_0113287656 /NCGR_PEP_ID=MMETSP0008_2-20120614/31835_1 /TAXON_ID=97485 /ORGANISM="Prymnesium parvum" /LENGTH=75 /DNA_ID=CAMNT_0000138923 /DNA_START=155 /DNA_END=379 /DNA_ORIENTATION=+ /assembly_acc=CAM_ASM_000153